MRLISTYNLGSFGRKLAKRHQLFGQIVRFGIPAIWFTINPRTTCGTSCGTFGPRYSPIKDRRPRHRSYSLKCKAEAHGSDGMTAPRQLEKQTICIDRGIIHNQSFFFKPPLDTPFQSPTVSSTYQDSGVIYIL